MRIAIVEDNAMLLANLGILLNGESGFAVTGSWTNAEDALKAAIWESTDILLADLDLPGMSGVELITRLKSKHASLNCMAYTVFEDKATVFAAIKAGACGYILKGSSPRELVEALRQMHEGGAPMSPRVARKIIHEFQQSDGVSTDSQADRLTSREQEVLRLLEQGRSYKEAGSALGISANTIHAHIKRIYEKLQSCNRAEVLRKARQRGWI